MAAGPEAARVAIIRYDDRTGTKNFEYMPGSLQEAITKSMHKKFEFIEVDAAKVEPIAAEIRTKNKGRLTPKEAAEICRKADIDILIYGNFTFDKANNEIEIHTEISLGSPDKFRSLQPLENKVDTSIFQAAERVAGDITAEITRVAKEQQAAKGQMAKETKGKTQLEKIEKTKAWTDISWMLSVGGGPAMVVVKTGSSEAKLEAFADALAFRRLKGSMHLGLMASWGSLRSVSKSAPARSDLEIGSGAVMAGYFFDISPRWRATTALGGGYFFGKFNRYPDCTSGCDTAGLISESYTVRNPFALARLGIHFLIFSLLSVGLETDYRLFFDSGAPLQAVHAAFSISAIF